MLNILSYQRNVNENNSENGQDQKHWWQFMLERMWGNGNTPPLLVGVQICTAVLRISMAISKKIRKQEPVIPLLGIYLKDAQSYHKNMCSSSMFTVLLLLLRIIIIKDCFSYLWTRVCVWARARVVFPLSFQDLWRIVLKF